MWNEFKQHRLAYAVLLLLLFSFVMLFFGVWPNRVAQRALIGVLIIFYTLWGVTTHLKTDHITKGVIYEYFGVAILAGSLLLLVTV